MDGYDNLALHGAADAGEEGYFLEVHLRAEAGVACLGTQMGAFPF